MYLMRPNKIICVFQFTWNFKAGTVGWKIFLFCWKFLYGVNRKTILLNREVLKENLKNFRVRGEKLGMVG